MEHFIRVANRDLGRQVRTVAPEAMQLLEAYGWPGNVRELHSTIHFALVHAGGDVLTAECLPQRVPRRDLGFGGAAGWKHGS